MGAGGVEKVIEVELDETEKAAFDVSINAVRDLTEWVENNFSA
jgi:malate dehydrogenase